MLEQRHLQSDTIRYNQTNVPFCPKKREHYRNKWGTLRNITNFKKEHLPCAFWLCLVRYTTLRRELASPCVITCYNIAATQRYTQRYEGNWLQKIEAKKKPRRSGVSLRILDPTLRL